MDGTHYRRGTWTVMQDGQDRKVRGTFATVRGLAHLLGDIAFTSTIRHQIQRGNIPTIFTTDRVHLIPLPVVERILDDRLPDKKFTTWKKYKMQLRRSPGGRSAGDGAEPTSG